MNGREAEAKKTAYGGNRRGKPMDGNTPHPLNYAPPSGGPKTPKWLVWFAAAACWVAGGVCYWIGFSVAVVIILEFVGCGIILVAAVALGIRYGTQDEKFWT